MDNAHLDRIFFEQKIRQMLDDGIGFSFKTVNLLLRSVIYIYLKDQKIIYVGRSKRGILRAVDPRHSQIMRNYDRLLVYPIKNEDDAEVIEAVLIKAFKPKYNKTLNRPKWFKRKLFDIIVKNKEK